MTVGVAVMLIAVVVFVSGSGFAGELVARTCAAYSSVVGGSVDCPTVSDRTLTPYERATSGKYVAMGDSYSSGEGAKHYADGTNFDDRDDLWPFNDDEEAHNRCRRSSRAYSAILSGQNDFKGGYSFVACSGAKLAEYDNPNPSNTGEDPQMAALGDDTSLVTMTIGGNDLGFADVISDCVLNGGGGVAWTDGCQEKHDKRIEARLVTLRAELVAQYLKIKAAAPNARIIVIGYPQLFIDNPTDNFDNLLYAQDQVWMNAKGAELNAMLASAAREAGVEFVDPTAIFKGHGIGSNDAWINDLDWGGPGMMPVDPGSFHPNAQGQAAIAALVQQQLEHPAVR